MKTEQIPHKLFTEPQLCETGNDWYVFFRFFHDGRWHLKKCKEGINRIADKRERRKIGNALAEARLKWLNEGWNPIIDPEFKLKKITKTDERKKMLLGALWSLPKPK